MKVSSRFELPPHKQGAHRRAVRLEQVTIVYLITAIAAIYLTLGSSQAMKTAWLEDIMSLLPPISFLFASRFRDRSPDDRFPYGYHRSVSIAFLVSAVALTSMGAFLLYDAVTKLLSFEHPSIGVVQPFGEPVWLGWLMLPALAWSAIPAFILGRVKLPLARELHDKVLHADAHMNKADWLTAGAAMLGVIGIGVGLWWADAVAAAVISLDILSDGVKHLRQVVADLMDSVPTTVEGHRDSLAQRLESTLEEMPWVRDASVRLREDGRIFMGEALVVPTSTENLVPHLRAAQQELERMDWKLHEIVIMPVERIEPEAEL